MPTRNLLLISSSRVHGTGFLEHCSDAIETHFTNVNRVFFIPYALADHDRYESIVAEAFKKFGMELKSIHHASDPVSAVKEARGIFIGGVNSFRLLKTLYDLDLVSAIQDAVGRGVPYMGSSAGTNMACPTIRTTNDMPIVEPPSFNALNLVPFQINPHYLDADPNSTHKGETRQQRLSEFNEENDCAVAALREGSWLQVIDDQCELHGTTGMVLFRAGQQPEQIDGPKDLSHLL